MKVGHKNLILLFNLKPKTQNLKPDKNTQSPKKTKG